MTFLFNQPYLGTGLYISHSFDIYCHICPCMCASFIFYKNKTFPKVRLIWEVQGKSRLYLPKTRFQLLIRRANDSMIILFIPSHMSKLHWKREFGKATESRLCLSYVHTHQFVSPIRVAMVVARQIDVCSMPRNADFFRSCSAHAPRNAVAPQNGACNPSFLSWERSVLRTHLYNYWLLL